MVVGAIQGKQVLIMKGRFHAYEGYGAETVSFPVRVMKELGVETLIVTNAAGGINESYQVGDLMVISDHLNMTFRNPLIGPNDSALGVRFQEGVYVGLLGPNYETPAEIRMFRTLGGDSVGMSTVPEVIVARHAGIEVLGFSCISNMASGILDQPLSHAEVMETTEKVKPKFLKLVLGIIEAL
ncbi:Purine nucleoside phosphorylase 1 [compost metagenome]